MSQTAKKFLDSWGKDRENINNINNNNNILTTLTTQAFHANARNEGEVIEVTSASQISLASPSAKSRPLGHKVTLPPNWRGVKLDLFCNGNTAKGRQALKIKLGVITKDGDRVNLTASMNSEFRYLYYRIPDEQKYNPHWTKVRETQEYLKANYMDVRASKFYIGKKQNIAENLMCFLYKEGNVWMLDVIREGIEYLFEISGMGSEDFRSKNGIATAYYGNDNNLAKQISLKELGI